MARLVALALLSLAAGVGTYSAYYGVSRPVYGAGVQVENVRDDPVKLSLSLHREGKIRGTVVNTSKNMIITAVSIHVRFNEPRGCGEKLVNHFSDINFEENCKSNPNHVVDDTVEGNAYECFRGEIGYLQQASCSAMLLSIPQPQQTWDFFVLNVEGHPVDPLGIFNP